MWLITTVLSIILFIGAYVTIRASWRMFRDFRQERFESDWKEAIYMLFTLLAGLILLSTAWALW